MNEGFEYKFTRMQELGNYVWVCVATWQADKSASNTHRAAETDT